jgi:acyl-CoA synthetase (AMP-forming)/AMP-acid ligase II
MNPAGEGWASIPAMTAGAAERFGDRTAVVDGDLQLSYAALFDRSRTFAAALVASGVGRGDRVAIWCFNCAEWIVAVLGTFQAGAVLVPVNTRFKGNEAADLLARSHVRALVTVTDFLDTDYVALLEATGVELPDLDTVVIARGPARGDAVDWTTFLARADDAALANVDERRAALGPEDPSDILFTSGTTGVPKGVVMTHGRTLGVATDWVAMTGLSADDTYLMVNPYFHMFGLKAGILASVAAGATMLPEPVFDVDRVLTRVAAEQVTVLPGAPTIYQAILDHPGRDGHDLSTLRVAVTGAADIPVELIRRVDAELPFDFIVTGYGLTEAGTASATSPEDDPETVATTVGRPRPGFEVLLADTEGQEVPAGEPGEILLRGPTVMAHYLDDPEATAQTLSPDGWLRTGDLGLIDDHGCLRIVGRVKDMFIVGGFNAYPAEIENALLRHADIQQAAVIGVPDERLGEVGMAFVVLGPGADVDAEAIIAWSRDEMANYKVPRAVVVVDELPLNATGKVEKNVLRERAKREVPGDG